MKNDSREDILKKVKTSAIALTAAGGILVSNLFGAPMDMLVTKQEAPEPMIYQMELYQQELDDDPGEDEDEENENEEEEEEKDGISARIRRAILKLPVAVRGAVCVPLWCVGYGITAVFSLLWSVLLSPVLSVVLHFILNVLITIAVIYVLLKLLFPWIPWRKLLSKKGLIITAAVVIAFWGFDAVAPCFWSGYEEIAKTVDAVGMFVLPATAVTIIYFKVRKKFIAFKDTLSFKKRAPAEI